MRGVFLKLDLRFDKCKRLIGLQSNLVSKRDPDCQDVVSMTLDVFAEVELSMNLPMLAKKLLARSKNLKVGVCCCCFIIRHVATHGYINPMV